MALAAMMYQLAAAASRNSALQFGRTTVSHKFHTSAWCQTEQSSADSDVTADNVEVEKKVEKKFKINYGGDINTVSILGTIIGIRIFPMQSKPEREWAAFFVRTRTMKDLPVSEESDSTSPIVDMATALESNSGTTFLRPYFSNSARVHIFDPRILKSARRAKVGDRVFVSGFLSYYKHPESAGSFDSGDSGKLAPKISAVVAQRIVFMGHEMSESLPVEQPQELELQ